MLLLLGSALAGTSEGDDARAPASGPQLSITVQNPTGESWQDAPVVVPWDEEMQRAFGDTPVAIVAPQAAYVQRDDLDADGVTDELVFLLTLGPHETVTVTIARGSVSPPVARTDAGFYPKALIGAAWESDCMAYRLYWNDDTAIDVFAKKTPTLAIRKYASEEVNYHVEPEWGLDVLKVGKALGAGGFGVWHEGRIWKPAQVQRSCKILATGPYRAVVDVTYENWVVGEQQPRELSLHVRLTICAGQAWGTAQLTLESPDGKEIPALVAGIVIHPETIRVRNRDAGYLGRWGLQALGDHQVPKSANLGMGITFDPDLIDEIADDDFTSYARFRPSEKPVTYRYHANWGEGLDGAGTEQEYESQLVGVAQMLPRIINVEVE